MAKPRTTILPLLKQDSDCIFVCLYRGIHRPFFHTAARPESRPGADVRRRPLGSTTYTPPSPHTGIELGPMTADGRDGDPIPSSWKTKGERRTQSEPDAIPKTRHEPSIHPTPPQTAKRKLARKESRRRYLELPISAGLPGLGQSDAGKPLVPSRRVQANLPRRQSDAVQIYFPPSHHPLVFFLCNMSLPVHHPWGASPLTRRASSEEQKLTKQASQVLPPVLPDCSTDLASQNLQQPVVERNDEYRSPAPTPHLSRPRRRRRWATASPPPPFPLLHGDAGT